MMVFFYFINGLRVNLEEMEYQIFYKNNILNIRNLTKKLNKK